MLVSEVSQTACGDLTFNNFRRHNFWCGVHLLEFFAGLVKKQIIIHPFQKKVQDTLAQ